MTKRRRRKREEDDKEEENKEQEEEEEVEGLKLGSDLSLLDVPVLSQPSIRRLGPAPLPLTGSWKEEEVTSFR